MPQQEKPFAIALTGHRPNRLPGGYNLSHPFYKRLTGLLQTTVRTELSYHERLSLHSGMALGADTVWAQVITQMRQENPGRIHFVAEVPFMDQAARWPKRADKEFWERLVAEADEVHVYAEQFSNRAMQARNEGMIDAADLLLAVYDGTASGGTANAVRYAKKRQVTTIVLDPRSL